MPKDKDSFFDDDEEDALDEADAPKKDDPPKSETPPAKQDPPEDTTDKTDWKAKYEAAEAEKLDRSYYDELLDRDDTLEGDTLDDLPMGKRYRELRKLGLSADEAFGAVAAQSETAPRQKAETNKSHVSAPSFRSTPSKSKMDRATSAMMDDLLPDLSQEEREALYRRVNKK